MKMRNILFVAPEHNVGGILSWSRTFRNRFPQYGYTLYSVNNAPVRAKKVSIYERVITGFSALFRIRRDVKHILLNTRIDIMHMTTSGSIGALRDWCIGRICREKKVKTILHCHYGCIPQIMKKKGFIRWLTVQSMKQYDQIWVLDKKSYATLQGIKIFNRRVKLTPNGIEIDDSYVDIAPKKYTNVAFVGNMLPSKGVSELVSAMRFVNTNVRLHLVGGGDNSFIEQLKALAASLWDNRIKYYGELTNREAIDFMKKMDIIALPTYYESEAFPISVLEAMSLGKMVISTRRAAIPDMLVADDGTQCGCLIEEKNVNQLADAINWCYDHPTEADKICENAYKKACGSYKLDVVYAVYQNNYKELLED